MRFLTLRFLLLVLAEVGMVVPLQGCKRLDAITRIELHSPVTTALWNDDDLTARVRLALEHSPVARTSNIGIESHQGTVLLTGMAVDPLQIDLAVFVAQNVAGVYAVNSYMFSGHGEAEATTTQGAAGPP